MTRVMVAKMNYYLLIYVCLMGLLTVNSQMTQYANRFRNFSIESETGSAHLVTMKIYQDKKEHKIAATVNITKDIHVKSIEVIVYRCSFEKSDCENFQKWKFTRNLKSVVYMKNQIWTPIFDHITPKLDIPFIKKNIYQTPNANLDTKAGVTWYPELANYFWRADVILNDQKDKKAFVMKLELEIFTFVERNNKKDRGSTRITKTRSQ
ncbi:uncharacterized protein LOC135834367 [Planococcus citri]|uniref:uncharacterized protein LOC135834367 n=1 Tax=Planococcus citri TaxID=170843 RepID=UPI0031F8BFA6